MSDKTAAPPPPVDVDDDAPPPEYKPNPKVAVVVAGAALAVTIGLTVLVIPYVRQAAKMQAPPQFLSHTNKARPPRLPSRLPASTPAALPSGSAPASTEAPSKPVAEEDPALVAARSFNDREEALLYGPTATDEHGEPVEPVSPWLGFQALGIATALVGLSAGLGIFGAAKYLGVNSMEEFAHKMRGGLEGSMPELIAQVRREGDEAPPETPALLTRHGELDETKFDNWIISIEEEEAAAKGLVAVPAASAAAGPGQPQGQGESKVLAALTEVKRAQEEQASKDELAQWRQRAAAKNSERLV